MKIVHVSTNDVTGGAARATFRLHKGLQGLGYESLMYVANRVSHDGSVVKFAPTRTFQTRLTRYARRRRIARSWSRYESTRPAGCELFSEDRSPFRGDMIRQLPPCDVVNLHWIANFVDYDEFFDAIPDRVPIVWRLADMNAFTGGCHFDDECGKFRNGCGACPQLGSGDDDDLSRRVWKRKQQAFARRTATGLQIVALCGWMKEQVSQSPLLRRFPVSIIPNGIDLTVFTPRDRRFSREVLHLPEDARVILFVADGSTNRRKGFSLLAEALKSLDCSRKVFLLSVGHGTPSVDGRIRHLHLGPVDYHWLSLVYSAADLFVIPSIQDNLPNTVLESMACGTPAVGFAVGGIPEMVRPDLTGQLVPPLDTAALSRTINELLRSPAKLREMAITCRRIAVEEYSVELQARRYGELYSGLLRDRARLNLAGLAEIAPIPDNQNRART